MDRFSTENRRRWMGLLARSRVEDLEAPPVYALPRHPETGLVMVRGRAGGVGQRFNLGEMTMTRCAARLDSGAEGHGYVAGRNARHAELAAVFDALLQTGEVDEDRLATLAERREAARRDRAAKAAATRVEFFTMVRGDE